MSSCDRYLVLIVLVGVLGLGWSGEETVFTNSWAVEVKGGSHVADQLAEKHGFINKGLVKRLQVTLYSLLTVLCLFLALLQVGSLENMYHFVHSESPSRVTRSASSLHPKHRDLVAEEQVRVALMTSVK